MTFRSASSGRYRFAVRIVGIALLVIAGMWGSGADAASASADTGIRGYRIAMAVASVVISIGALLVALLHIRRRRLEASVRALQERESALIDASMDAIIGIDRAQRIVLFSAAAERLFQLPAASARGEPLERLLPARFRDAYQRNLRDFIEGGLSGGSIGQSRELKVLKADGAELAVEAAIARICAGGETLFTITLRDVSEKMQLEQALREQTERLQVGQRIAEMVVMDWDISNDRLAWSDSPERIRGPLPAQGKYPPWVQQVHPEDLEYFLAMRTAGIDTLQPLTLEYRLVRTDGQVIWLRSIQASYPGPDGKAARMIVSMQDITARKKADAELASLEARLRESQKMEAIGTLAGGIAHDFNNIIATILGHVELARNVAGIDPAVLESLDEIRKAGRRARDLVHQILAFSRREPTRRQPVELLPIIEEAARLLRAMLPARIKLEVRHDDADPIVLADRTQLQQVVINLANNSLHATRGEAGRIEFQVDTVVLDAVGAATQPALRALAERHPGRVARLRVSDTGHGMDAPTLARMFEPFFTTKAAGEGTGLGLSVVYGIVQAHEGAIVVESQPDKGTTFDIFLPLAAPGVAPQPEESAGRPPTALTPSVAGRHILYIDDDESLLLLVTRLLQRRGLRVSAHGNQNEALDTLRADPMAVDLVVTDYNMPGMSGLQVARAIRQIRPDLPVVVASGFIDETLEAQAKDAGIREVIFKATAVEDYCGLVERLLAREMAQAR